MRIKSLSLAVLTLATLAPVMGWASGAVPVTRTLELSRPVLDAGKDGNGPRNFGPGGAKKILGRVTLIPEKNGSAGQLLTLSGTKVIVNATGCGTPTLIVSNDSFYVTWPTECVLAGGKVVVQFASTTEISSFNSGDWRDNTNFIVATASGQGWTGVPGVGARGLALVASLLGIGGLVAIRRRRLGSALS